MLRCTQRDTYSKQHVWDLVRRPEKICPPNCPRKKKKKTRVFKSSQVFAGHSASHHSCNGKSHLPLFDDVLPTLKGLSFQKTHQPQWRWNHRINEEWPCWSFSQSDGTVILWKSYNACRHSVLLCVDGDAIYIIIYMYIHVHMYVWPWISFRY